MRISQDWEDYQCLASGDGEKIEKWGNIILRRPDPQIIWKKSNSQIWNEWDGFYHRSNKGGGSWEFKKKIPDEWKVHYKELTFQVSPTNFKHTGIFPEQAVNWDYVMKRIRNDNRVEFRVLNLFAYTGCATMAASMAGASEVVHVDASRGMIEWAKKNRDLCGLTNHKIRFIVDDVIKFLEREKRRGRTYHGIIMDPPSYGRGPNGEVWKLEDNLQELLFKARDVLDKDYSFLLINSYTTGVSPTSLNNILKLTFSNNQVETGEIGLPILENNLVLPCGIYGRVTKD
ncbi:MAG: class I SAM-dependent methyltransferase [Erysipelotrichaceae bacterium]|nr:class I SAM-dependent methyltransferase [Erysipelotrichaceae bacterium]